MSYGSLNRLTVILNGRESVRPKRIGYITLRL